MPQSSCSDGADGRHVGHRCRADAGGGRTVPESGLNHRPGPSGVRPATMADVPTIAALEQELCGIRREGDFRYFIENRAGFWHLSVCEREGGRLDGFMASCGHHGLQHDRAGIGPPARPGGRAAVGRIGLSAPAVGRFSWCRSTVPSWSRRRTSGAPELRDALQPGAWTVSAAARSERAHLFARIGVARYSRVAPIACYRGAHAQEALAQP